MCKRTYVSCLGLSISCYNTRRYAAKRICAIAFIAIGLLLFRWTHIHRNVITKDKTFIGENSSSNTDWRKCSNAERLSNIRDKCKSDLPGLSPDPDDPLTYQRLLLDEVHKIIFCVIPKSGSTSIKTLLRDVSHNPEASKAHVWKHDTLAKYADLDFMSSLPVQITKEKLYSKQYKKFLLVRHPLTRLSSAFKNKFFDITYSFEVYTKILKTMRPGKVISRYDRPTWEEFVRYLPTNRDDEDDVSNDRHWRRQVDMCHPCLINYDYIMRLETLSDDIKPLIEILETDPYLKEMNKSLEVPKSNPTKVKMNSYFDSLSAKDQKRMMDRYKDDMQIFGYRVTSPGNQLSCRIESTSGSCC